MYCRSSVAVYIRQPRALSAQYIVFISFFFFFNVPYLLFSCCRAACSRVYFFFVAKLQLRDARMLFLFLLFPLVLLE